MDVSTVEYPPLLGHLTFQRDGILTTLVVYVFEHQRASVLQLL